MSKATVTRIFLGGTLAVLAGAVLGVAAVALAIANDVFVLSGDDIVGLRGSPLAWSLLGVGVVAGASMLGGMVAGVVAWIGALLNSAQLESKRWFVALIVLGILSVGFLAMIAWVVAGPDGTAGPAGRRAALATGDPTASPA
jgi:hypothetical protein